VRVDAKRHGAAAAVAEPAGHSTQVDSGRDQLGCVVVPQIVQATVHAGLGREALKLVRHRVGQPRVLAEPVAAEHVGIVAELPAKLLGELLAAAPTLGEHLHGGASRASHRL
jgi:hypothetical protein